MFFFSAAPNCKEIVSQFRLRSTSTEIAAFEIEFVAAILAIAVKTPSQRADLLQSANSNQCGHVLISPCPSLTATGAVKTTKTPLLIQGLFAAPMRHIADGPMPSPPSPMRVTGLRA